MYLSVLCLLLVLTNSMSSIAFPQGEIIKGVNRADQVIEKAEGKTDGQGVAAGQSNAGANQAAGPLLLAIAGFTALLRKKSNSSRTRSH